MFPIGSKLGYRDESAPNNHMTLLLLKPQRLTVAFLNGFFSFHLSPLAYITLLTALFLILKFHEIAVASFIGREHGRERIWPYVVVFVFKRHAAVFTST